jgi:CRISPR-associated protein Csm1
MNKNDLARQCLILGALLHDIGKFAQRAGEVLDNEDKKLAEICCPKNIAGVPTHTHAVLSGSFVRKFLGKNWAEVENLTLYHHRPAKSEDKIIQLADWLSCGERRDKEPGEEINEVNKEPLISIFSQIVIEKINEHFCPVLSLSDGLEKLYPKKQKSEAISQNPEDKNSFEYQWKEFCKESQLLAKDNPGFNMLIQRLLSLLEKYTLFIPSSAYKDKPEISLYHHLKSTSAIATCLYDLNLSEEKIDKIISAYQYRDEETLQQNDFLLVNGDISGIQDFIYSVSSKHALKGLRGRSFYIQLLSETVARCVLDEFNLSLCNLLYCGGGNFLILLPNLTDISERITHLYKKINHNFYVAHQGKIGVVISCLTVSYKDFQLEFSESIWKQLGEVSARQKKIRFSNIIDKNIFEEFDEGGEHKGCEICGEEMDADSDKCKLCESFELLSLSIKNTNYMEIEKISKMSDINIKVKNWSELLESMGYEYHFLKDKRSSKLIFKINNTDFLSENLIGYRFEAFYSPEGTLGNISEKATGIKKWGALRMDIDNLSKIFSEGLKNKTISRMNMLSHLISLFFSVRVRNIIEEPEYKDKSIVVYSGGDDLFIIGAWSVLPEIAQKIYYDFREFTCCHPKITLSGGIYIAPSDSFPVYKAAKEAGSAEEKAKEAEDKKGNKKDKLTFFDEPLKWETELKELEKIKDKIVKLLEDETSGKKMPRSLLTMLYSSWQDKELLKKNRISMVRIWRLLYGLRRLVERYLKGEDEQTALLSDLRDTFIKDTELRENLDIAVRWAEYLTRKEQKQEVRNE